MSIKLYIIVQAVVPAFFNLEGMVALSVVYCMIAG